MQELENLSSLRVLDLRSNRLTEIPPNALSSLTALEELYLSHNGLTAISGLETNTRLRTIDISSNRITHLTNVGHLVQLEEFWANNNLLESFPEVERELGGLEGLHTVYFEHNPLQKNAGATYRNKIRLCLKAVRQIDATYPSTLNIIDDRYVTAH
jgi:protein phosphatase 1 regulatory subunit 7